MTGIYNRFVLILSWLIFIKASSITPMSLDATLNSYETVELTNPLRLESIPDFYPYESVLKLVISVKMPTFKKAAANEAMKSVFSRIKEELKAMDAQDVSAHKQRLQAPINSVQGRMSDSILGTEGLIRSYTNIFEENDIPGFSIASMNTTDFETLMTDALKEIMEDATPAEPEPNEIEENVPALLELQDLEPVLNQTGGSVDAMSASADDTNTTTTTHKPPCSVQVEKEKMLKFSRILLNHMNEAVASCQQRKLPRILVGNFLRNKLAEISQASSSASSIYDETDFFTSNGRVSLPRGYKLVISPDKFQLYANQTLTDCLFTEKQIYVVVNVPLVSRNSKWQIYQSHHSKFIFEEQVCSIGFSNNGLLASKLYGFDKNNDNIVELDSHSHSSGSRYPSTCEYNRKVQINSNSNNYTNITSANQNHNQLCFIPQTQGEHKVNEKDSNSKTADSFTCAAGILNKVPLKDLKHMCQFNCQAIDTLTHGNVNGNVQYFQQLSNKNQILLTNVKRLKVACPQYNFDKSFEKIGGLKISMHSCDCVIWADDQLYSFPCEGKVSSGGIGSHIIGVGSAPVNNANFTQDDESAELGTESELSDEHYDEDESPHDKDGANNRKGIDVAYLIPITWTKNTKYNMLVEENISFKIKNHKEIIDSDWHKRSGAVNDHGFGAKYWNFFQGEDYSD